MRATELRNWFNQQIQEFGDYEVAIPDQLESTWLRTVVRAEYDPQREVYKLTAERV